MEFKTQEELFESMLGDLRAWSGCALGEHSEPALRLRALASELEALGAECGWIWRQAFAQTAEGESLDAHAELRGVERRAGTAAEGSVRFFTSGEVDVDVPEGTAVFTSDLKRFFTSGAITIPAGSEFGDAPAFCENAGTAGNVAAGAIYLMSEPPAGVTACTNVAAFSGGSDREDDESLRARVLEQCRSVRGGANAAYYKALALETDGVVAADVYPRPRGRGTVGIYLAGEDGAVSSAVQQAVLDHITAEREIAVDVYLQSISVRTINLDFVAYVEPGYDADAVKASVREAVAPFFGGHTLGKAWYCSDVIAAVDNAPGLIAARSYFSMSDYAAQRGMMNRLGSINLRFTEVSV